MHKFLMSREILDKLHEKKIFMTDRIPAGIEGRINREFFYTNECRIGHNCGLLGGVHFPKVFGSYTYSFSPLDTFFSVGNYCSIAGGMRILGTRHPIERFTTSSITYDTWSPIFKGDFRLHKTSAPPPWNNEVIIENDVWIGANVTLKKGVTLHTGCVVGANSLVTHDVPPYAVVGGVPAKLIKYRFDSHTIRCLLESRWYEYDVNYLDVPSDIYVYDFIKHFNEHKDKLPKLETVKLDYVIESLTHPNRVDFRNKMQLFMKDGNLIVNATDVADKKNWIILMEALYLKGCVKQNEHSLNEMLINDSWKQMILQIFSRLEADKRIVFFAMKGDATWFHYKPYDKNVVSHGLTVPLEGSGETWPSADRKNTSTFATFMSLKENGIYISIELAAKESTKARELAENVGYEKDKSSRTLIRLKTKLFQCKDVSDIRSAVNLALDELCNIGNKLTVALEK